jgi:phosphoribosyl 1,2-cyclic phosphodiesterase
LENAKINIAILGSGSSGNSIIFYDKDVSFVLDNGFTYKEFFSRTKQLKIDERKIKLILLTHPHTDHISGIAALSRNLKIPVFHHNELSRSAFGKFGVFKSIPFINNEVYSLLRSRLKILPFQTFHDIFPSSGFYFQINGIPVTYITDTGMFDEVMLEKASQSKLIFLESNYDNTMLDEGSYPQFLKDRIKSYSGHLSNDNAIDFIEDIMNTDSKKQNDKKILFLCHLSENNNSPQKIVSSIKNNFENWKKFKRNDNIHAYILKGKHCQIKIFVIPRDTMFHLSYPEHK